MAEESVEVSEKVNVGDEDLGASAEAHAGASAEVTDTSVSAEAKKLAEKLAIRKQQAEEFAKQQATHKSTKHDHIK